MTESTRATTAPDLLPCPFCGCTDEIYVGAVTYCDNCGGEGPSYYREGQPVASWNDRPAQPSPSTGGEPATDSAGREPLDVEFKRLADTILQATTNGTRLEALRGIAELFDKCAAREPAPVARELDVEAERLMFEAECRGDYENMGGEHAGPGKQGWWYWADETADAWNGWFKRAARAQATAESAPASAAPDEQQLRKDFEAAYVANMQNRQSRVLTDAEIAYCLMRNGDEYVFAQREWSGWQWCSKVEA